MDEIRRSQQQRSEGTKGLAPFVASATAGSHHLTSKRAKWQLHTPAPRTYLESFPDLPRLLVQCLYNRGITDPGDVRPFLLGESDHGDPFRMKGVAEAVTRIRHAIREKELIAVYGDFDADGVTGTALLSETLSSLGGVVTPYIPHRVREGYGLHQRAIRTLAAEGVTLVVTVDCGARASQEVEYAARLGVDVIITDHHAPLEQLPPAVTVVDTKRPDCAYPFKGLSGVGIAFKLAQALLLVSRQLPLPGYDSGLDEEQLLDLVALGTVADLSPLLGENRSLVKRGLAELRQPRRAGISALMEEAHVQSESVTAATISYVLAPRLNAAGRMDDAMLSYDLLRTASPTQARELAQLLERQNRQRREMTLSTVEAVRHQVMDQSHEPLLFVTGEDFPIGVIGLAAHRLCDEHHRPAVVVTKGERYSVSSARSIDEFDITAALDRCASLLEKHGGHSKAAGFTVSNENLPLLEQRLREIATERLAGLELLPTLFIDAEIPLSSLQRETFSILQQLEPLGMGNPEPLLLSPGVQVRESRVVGEDHLKLVLTDGRIDWDGIAFGMGNLAAELPPRIDIVYSPQVRSWRGKEQLQLRIEDFKPAG